MPGFAQKSSRQDQSWKPNVRTSSQPASPTTRSANRLYGGIFDYDAKSERLHVVNAELEDPAVWNDPKHAQDLGREKKALEDVVETLSALGAGLGDANELFELAAADDDDATLESIEHDADASRRSWKAGIPPHVLQPRRPAELLPGHPGRRRRHGSAGLGLHAAAPVPQVRRAQGFKAEVLEESEGEVAGIKSATIKLEGEYAFGYLRTETGVHRLVRKSPFDSSGGRHTSFASVFVYPEVDDSFEVEVNPADLRVDTYRASGAGGQHINKTDSAVRLTHMPTGIVVQCQNDRSQHRNRAEAMQMLKSKLYELEMRNRMAEQQKLEDSKTDVGWGHQIRSYVLDQSRIKDLRTNVEISNTQKVLDGDLDPFIQASLKQGI